MECRIFTHLILLPRNSIIIALTSVKIGAENTNNGDSADSNQITGKYTNADCTSRRRQILGNPMLNPASLVGRNAMLTAAK